MFSQTLKEQVSETLDLFIETRNSDVTLMITLWERYYPEYIQHVDGVVHIKLLDLYELPRESTIVRIRAQIQNDEGKYLPTEWKIAKQRGINEDAWKKSLGYYVESNNQLRLAI